MQCIKGLSQFSPQKSSWVGHELHKTLTITPTFVGGGILAIVEVNESREASHIMLLAERIELRTVQSSKGDFLIATEEFSSCSVLGLGHLTVATPGGVEHHQAVLLLLQGGLESLISEVVHLETAQGHTHQHGTPRGTREPCLLHCVYPMNPRPVPLYAQK